MKRIILNCVLKMNQGRLLFDPLLTHGLD
jgi:hypothetical protein